MLDFWRRGTKRRERRGRRSGEGGESNMLDFLTGPSNPFCLNGTFRASADPRKFGRKKGQVDIMRLIGRKKRLETGALFCL